MSDPDREHVLHELSRAPTTGITRGQLAVPMLDVDYDVTEALDDLVQSGQVVTTIRTGLMRYHPLGGA